MFLIFNFFLRHIMSCHFQKYTIMMSHDLNQTVNNDSLIH
jgi:hypothetical protein